MKLYRYMSAQEFNDLCIGMDMVNENPHECCATNSIGFCFLGEHTKEHYGDRVFSPTDCYDFLSGIVSPDVLVEFDAPDDAVSESYGTYADPDDYDCDLFNIARIGITEYCTTHYSRDTFRPLRYCIPYHYRGAYPAEEAIWYNCNLV